MGLKDNILAKIVHLEWKMFQNVKNIGGKAFCQEDYRTFKISRLSQAKSWSKSVLESYFEDLKKAQKQDRNLLTEKYARMMASTSATEYENIKHMLPPLEDGIPALVEKIITIAIKWEEELLVKFPNIIKRGRPIYTSQDTSDITSFETYLRAELLTYSKKTLERLYENYLQQKSESINGSEIILDYMIKQYGYSSLEQANDAMKIQQ